MRFDIEPGELGASMDEFSLRTGIQLSLDGDRTVKTLGVHGLYGKEEALMLLLRGTPYTCERVPGLPSQIKVRPLGQQRPGRRCVDSGSSEVPASAPPRVGPIDDLDQVEVRGERRLGTHFHDRSEVGSSVRTWDEEEMRAASALTLPDLLEGTENFPGGPSQDTHFFSIVQASNSGLTTGADIRGLGSSSTYVMFNNHPVAPSGTNASFYDLLQFPRGATTRMSLFPDGASGLYGNAAVAGTIEIDSVSHFTRPVLELDTGVSDAHSNIDRLSLLGGSAWDGGSIVLVGELARWDALPAYTRGQANTTLTPFSNPGNLITSLGTIFPISQGQTGQPLDFSTLKSGPARLSNPQLGADITPSQRREALYGSIEQNLSPSVSLWTYLLGTDREARERIGAQNVLLDVTQSLWLSNAPGGTLLEPYSLLKDFGSPVAAVDVRTLNAAVELHIKLPGHWGMVLSGSDSSETEDALDLGHANLTKLQVSVSDPSRANAFNRLGDGSNTPATLLETLEAPQRYHSFSLVRSYQVTAEGPLFPLGTQSIDVSLGIEARDQHFNWTVSDPAAENSLRRLLYAGFGEFRVPLLDKDTLVSPFRNLTLSLAGRAERYSDFGSSATPRVGLRWVPTDHIALRTAWSRAIRAPDLGDLSQRTNSSFAQSFNGTSALIFSGGSPNLTVERTLTRTAGITINLGDEAAPRWKMDVGYFDILSRDRIEQASVGADILTNPLYESYVHRTPDPVFQEYVCDHSKFMGDTQQACPTQPYSAIVDLRLHNAGILWTDGIDARGGVIWDSPSGTWALDLAGTYVLHYREAMLPNAPLVSQLNTESHLLALHLVGGASWMWAGLSTIFTVRYQNGYYNNETVPVSRVGSWTTADLRLAYSFGKEADSKAHPTEIALFGKNIFKRLPPFSNDVLGGVGYDQENADLTGQVVGLSVRVKL